MPPETSVTATDLEVDAAPVLSYPMAHNRLAVVSRIAVRHRGPAVAGASVQVEVRDVEGRIGTAWERLVDLAPDAETQLTDIDLHLDADAMLQIEAQRPAQVVVRVLGDGVLLAERSLPVELLAARQWVAVPPLLATELLAAFVMPNHPAVAALVAEASDLLVERTGRPVRRAYDEGPERVDATVRALFDAMQARQVRAIEPPASWSEVGQKVRTPDEVLDGGSGTCLDTVVVLAAALELIGVRPLLWLAEGYAFCGYWREEAALGAIAQTDPGDVAAIVNLVDLGLIRLVDPSLVTVRDEPATFDQAHPAAYSRWLTGDLGRILGVVDVWRARRAGVLPLPARTLGADGTVVITEYRAPERAALTDDRVPAAGGALGEAEMVPADLGAPAAVGTAEAAAEPTTPPVPARVRQWKNALLDLSLRNRLLNFTPRSAVALAVPAGHLGTVEDALHGGHAVHLLPADQLDEVQVARGIRTGRDLPGDQRAELFDQRTALFTDLPTTAYAGRLRALAYKARTIVEETGANNLYVAFGSLVWSLDGRELRSPLVLVPVRLVTRSRERAYRIELDEAGASTPNYCLLEKLRQVHGLTVPGLAEPTEDGAGIDLAAALLAMRTALAAEDLGYRVEETVDLAVLQFAKYRLWKDLDENWSVLATNPLVRHLIETPTDRFVDPAAPGAPDVDPARTDLDELAAACPVPADASQLTAVADAVAGRTFVLEGPPGTGKSQTITNLLTRAVADGKRVLFVAEKRAALDVVRARLDEVGLGPFSLDLHDKGSKPSAVRAQVRAALDHSAEVDEQGLGAELETLRAARTALARYAERLHAPNGAGLSFYSARTSLLALGGGAVGGAALGPVLPVPVDLLDAAGATRLASIRRALELLPDTAEPARPRPDHPWGFVGLADPARIDVPAVARAVGAVDAALRTATLHVGPATPALGTARHHVDLATLANLAAADGVTLDELDDTRAPRWREAAEALVDEVAAFGSAPHPGLELVVPDVLGLPLGELAVEAHAAAAGSWFVRRRRLAAIADHLRPGLRLGAIVKPARVPELTASLAALQAAAENLAFRAEQLAGVALPATWNPMVPEALDELTAQVEWLTWAGAAVDPDGDDPTADPFVRALRDLLSDGVRGAMAVGTVEALDELARAATALMTTVASTPEQVARWSADVGVVGRWIATAEGRAARPADDAVPVRRGADRVAEVDPVPLTRWVAFVGALEPLRHAHLLAAREALLLGTVDSTAAVNALGRGVALASARERRVATGLDGFDPLVQQHTIERFATSARTVRDLQRAAIPGEIVRARAFDAASAVGQIGALGRELARQRGGLGVRGLMATYGDLITRVLPCVLVSPDSLARFFPVQEHLFDLVVFDEASQIRVADAVGAMGRAGSVVVVGDSQQLPPTSFAEVSGGDPLDDPDDGVLGALTVEDEESILSECVQARVPRHWLSWHYRSQDESLIAFSNHQYYEDRLSSFPAPSSGAADPGPGGYGVSLVRVDGTFHRSARREDGTSGLPRTNPVEAQAVVEEIRRRFDAQPGRVPSLGVVTFNAQQRTLIESMLRDSGDDRLVEALDGRAPDGAGADANGSAAATASGEGLFVKNLENVQGDERDTILFSTAFSVNDRGYLPLNFGPLNRDGGERRLNVAITRARRQVVVFTSFDPEQLRAEETQSVGIKHLRAYLDLAATGSRTVSVAGRRPAVVDRHREQVADALRVRGYVVRTDVGLSEFRIDLVIADPSAPDRPLVAVLLDGPGWAARRTVGDRDGLPLEVLGRMLRWPAVERVWLPAWLAEPGDVLDDLIAAVEVAAADVPRETAGQVHVSGLVRESDLRRAISSLPRPAPDQPEPRIQAERAVLPEPASLADSTVDPEPAVLAEPAVLPGPAASAESAGSPEPTEQPQPAEPAPFAPWEPRVAGDRTVLDGLPGDRAAGQVRAVIDEVVAAEGPVHLDRLTRLVATAFGLPRMTPARVSAITAQVPPDLLAGGAPTGRDGAAGDAESFAWPRGLDRATWTGYRRAAPGTTRALEQVPTREIANVMVALVRASAGVAEAELLRATLAVLGRARLTEANRTRLLAALGTAVDAGRVQVSPDGFVTTL
ncbi:MAG TPA: DUF3320 domain-containing protein [Cellulomonas sp.]|uniref:DUF3320 domain-containing protein n=1 Tax=Cellulomonas sp. TaxID=40001 RepID=UPI002E303751|nr:DUF3320 domain-containing protein [Cellulomonas sp.]HEX5331756.1 DUF3320 domain-containing protein [Cellulomonas sp.]